MTEMVSSEQAEKGVKRAEREMKTEGWTKDNLSSQTGNQSISEGVVPSNKKRGGIVEMLALRSV